MLATTNFTVAGSTVDIHVELGLMSVEASFDRLAWAGVYYPRPRHSTSTILIHAIIVGAQVGWGGAASWVQWHAGHVRVLSHCQASEQATWSVDRGCQLPYSSWPGFWCAEALAAPCRRQADFNAQWHGKV